MADLIRATRVDDLIVADAVMDGFSQCADAYSRALQA
jgi:hypothetical protein